MPFQTRQLSVLAYANSFTLWHYRDNVDTLAQISAANYFGPAADMLKPDDMLIADGSDGTRIIRVVTATGSSVTTAHPSDGGRITLQVSVPAMNAAGDSFVVSPAAGQITSVRAVLEGATTAAAVLATRIGATAVAGGSLAIPAAAAGATFAASPTAANTVAAGQAIAVNCNGAGGAAVRAQVVIEITRA